jgi:hypothetical protein
MPRATGALALVAAVALLQWFGIRTAIATPPPPAGQLAPGAECQRASVDLPPLAGLGHGRIRALNGTACPPDSLGNLAREARGGTFIPRESSPLGTSAFGYVSGPYVALQLVGVAGAPGGIVSVGAAGSRTTSYSPGLYVGVGRAYVRAG